MPHGPTPRERVRAELTQEIKALALSQLRTSGAGDLSLRAVSRELGMASSALYRYFPSRDHLLTALIVDAYSDLADALEAADRALEHDGFRDRWLVACRTMRAWARGQMHRFALIYGSPVAGYRAPVDTVAPAERVMTALSRVVDDAAAAGAVATEPALPSDASGLVGQLRGAGQLLGAEIPPAVLAATVAGFGQLVGMINLELAGHFVGGFEPADELFEHTIERMADSIGL